MLKYDIEAYRKLFPVVQSGTIYLNHAATGPLSTRVVAAVNRYLNERSETQIDNYLSFQPILHETRAYAATLLNTTPDRIAFFDNTTNAINLLATGIEWKPGDRIILNDIEFPANVYPFLNLKRFGVEVDFVKSKEGRVLIEDIRSKISNRTKLISISHVQFLTGFRSDLKALGELCRKHDIIFSVDAIQSAGVVPIDVNEMKIDFLATGGQKWLMAPQGIAFAYISTQMQERLRQSYLGWTSIKDFFNDFTRYRLELDDTARRYENGTLNFIGITSLHESIATLIEVGIRNIEEHVLDLADILISEVEAIGLKTMVAGDRSQRAGIISIQVPNADAYSAKLREAKIEVAVRQGLIRVSPHFYNTKEEIEYLVDTMKRIYKYHSTAS
ncbi:MAG: aminotransferase class V-fold PLP-dependent enzyme [Candidatus Kryptoniota bacterium]